MIIGVEPEERRGEDFHASNGCVVTPTVFLAGGVAVVEVWHPAGGTGFWNENDLSMPLTGEEDATFFEFREAVREFFNQ